MGCGALCGDTATAETLLNRYSQRHYQQMLQQIKQNQQLIATPLYATFMNEYHRHPEPYHLHNRPQLIEGETVSDAVLLKWKLVVFGLDKDDKKYCECLGLNRDARSLINISAECGNQEESGIVVHECFVQIEKDIQRTFDTPIEEQKKRQFENVLKRIANHFPKMGYTQGINFIVSYLTLVGYCEKDCFEMFVHLATNKKYMLLGLYQDGFPLYNILTTLLQNVLQRSNKQLYSHMFIELGVDPSMWICKWFMTFYVYSFPKEMVKYVLDLVIAVGTLGIIMFAVSLIDQLEPILLEISELSDLNDFLTSLKCLQTFNHYVNMQRLMAKAYSVVLVFSDFDGVQKANFYGIYIKAYFQLNNMKRTSDQQIFSQKQQNFLTLLDDWRSGLIEQRNNFRRNSHINSISNLRLEIQSFEKSAPSGSVLKGQSAAVPASPQDPTMSSTADMPKLRKNSFSSKSEAPTLMPHRVEYHFNRINQKLEEEEQSMGSKYDRKSKRSQKAIDNQLDQLDKLQIQFGQQKKPAPNLAINNFTNPQNTKVLSHRVSTYNVNESNSLSLAGRNSLRNNDNSYDDVSVSSKQNSNRSKAKHVAIPPKNTRICNCKTKTEENRFSNIEHQSEIQQSKDQFSDKESNLNYSQNGEPVNDSRSNRAIDTHRDRPARKDFMVNSHGPGVLQRREEGRFQSDIEVMVLQQQFKKNKRGRVKQVPAEVPKDKLFKIGWQQQEDSLQEIQQMERLSQGHSHCSQLQNVYEIESIK